MRASFSLPAFALLAAMLLPVPAMSQGGPRRPPAVGVVTAEFKPMAESTEINGRIQARNRVDLIARVTAFMNERLFMEGADVKRTSYLYRLERAPFEADVEAKEAAVAKRRPNWRMPISRLSARRNCCGRVPVPRSQPTARWRRSDGGGAGEGRAGATPSGTNQSRITPK